MRRLGLFLLCLWLLAGPALSAQPVRVGVYQNSPKVDYSAAGKPEGIFVDLIEAIAREENWQLQYVPGTFSEGMARLAAGEIDLMPDVALTTDREGLYAFHREPVLSSWNQVYARRGSGIRSLVDLDGRRVAVLEGSMQQDYVRQTLSAFAMSAQLVPLPDFAAAFRAVAEGRADAVVTNRFYGARHAAASDLEDTAIIFNPSRLYFASPKASNRALLDAIDKHLRAFKADSSSVYYRSVTRWTAGDLRAALPAWLKWAVPAAAVLLLASLAWTVTLRRTARRLQESERRQRELATELGRILENSLDVICEFDPELRFVRASDAAQKLWGYPPAELVGKTYLDLIPPEDRERTLAVAQQVREGQAAHDLQSRALHRDGHVVPIVWSAVWSPAEQRLYCIARDDTERRRLLDEVQRRAKALERSTAQLALAKDAAESADRTKSAFLATMSHELRTPLNSIIGFTGIVLQGLAGPLNAEQAKQLGMVRDSSRHLLALINDVLDISKIEAGELSVASAPFDLAASISKVAGIVGPLAEKKGLALTVTMAPGVGPMTGDARRVEQILLNLLGNAIKFTERGSVALDVSLLPAWQDEPDHVPQRAVRMRVADTGIGIRPEDMALLFKPFRQVESAISRSHDGTGLGLAICKRLAGLMGGKIVAESVWQQGSVFEVTLPLSPDRAEGST